MVSKAFDSQLKKLNFKKVLYTSILVLILLFIFLFAKISIGAFILAIVLFVAAIFSKFYKHVTGTSLGFELVTFASICFFFAFESHVAAIILSLIMLILSTFLSGQITPAFFVEAVLYIIIGLVVIALGDFSVVKAMILVVLYNIVLQAVAMLGGFPFPRALINFIINIAVNYFLFTRFGERVVEALI